MQNVRFISTDNPDTLTKNLTAAQVNSLDNRTFISSVQSDFDVAMRIASDNHMKFKDPLLAIYHYRKHGEDFPSVVRNQNIEVYLTKVPARLIQDANLTTIETVNRPDGTSFVRKFYITRDDKFAVVMENSDGTQLDQTISSMYQKGGAYESHRSNFVTEPQWNFDLMNGIEEQITQHMGFRGLYSIFININHERFEYDDRNEKPELHNSD